MQRWVRAAIDNARPRGSRRKEATAEEMRLKRAVWVRLEPL
jgi:hypothetical protein